MIDGVVNIHLEATDRLTIHDATGQPRDAEVIAGQGWHWENERRP